MRSIVLMDDDGNIREFQYDSSASDAAAWTPALEAAWDALPRGENEAEASAETSALKRMIRENRLLDAEEFFLRMQNFSPEVSNLGGVIAEITGRFIAARQRYSKALLLDASYFAAELNLSRCYELYTFGETKIPICL